MLEGLGSSFEDDGLLRKELDESCRNHMGFEESNCFELIFAGYSRSWKVGGSGFVGSYRHWN